MPRTEVYQLRLTKGEKDQLAMLAREEGISIARFLRHRAGLDAEPEPTRIKPPPLPEEVRIESEAIRISNRERIPLSVARREAKKRLKGN